jgi:hypothetical protein
MLLPILGSHINKNKKKEKRKYKTILEEVCIYIYIYIRKSITKRPKNCWKLVEEDQIYKIKKFNSVFLTNKSPISKENSIWVGKFKIEYVRTQFEFFKVLFEFIEGLIIRKIDF